MDIYLKADKWENTVTHANTWFFISSSFKKKKAADKIFIHVLFTLPFKTYKTSSLCSTVGFCTRIQQITAKGLFIQRKHILATIAMLKV